ncbi:hypothetical protein GMI69_06895 [Eggerthellaceae bacterium zg-887]|uniref:hypothetical protein n=1 Tax=Xiamenia xianingshaonis TaxID=2682776 RepID=UPI001408A30D|nr:hypothetical protein [Xiamenia xianingshaonis]NHM16386.1 hypothetical protein [Xiamenia xianingshaonis]
MKLMERWRTYWGPEDERLVETENRTTRVGYAILLVGGMVTTYYAIMLDQVAGVADRELLTSVGQGVFPAQNLLMIVMLLGSFVPLAMQMREGIVDVRSRFAQAERVPWDYVVLLSLVIATSLGVLTALLRVVAEVQIVGWSQVAWAGDLAIGAVFFGLAFGLSVIVLAACFRSAIEQRRKLEDQLDD